MYCISGNVFFKSEGLVAGVVIQVVRTSSIAVQPASWAASQHASQPASYTASQPTDTRAQSLEWLPTSQPASQPTIKKQALFENLSKCANISYFSWRSLAAFRHVFDILWVSGLVLEPLRRQTMFLPVFIFENRTQNTPQIAPEQWTFAACFQGLQRKCSRTWFQWIQSRPWRKNEEKDSPFKEIIIVF